jgi:hypothetical protein
MEGKLWKKGTTVVRVVNVRQEIEIAKTLKLMVRMVNEVRLVMLRWGPRDKHT